MMGWPQVTIIALYALSLGVTLALHGKPRTGKHSFFTGLFGASLTLVPLYFGGFFG